MNKSELRSHLESERTHLKAEVDALTPEVQPSDERREGSPFGKREEEATQALELEKRLAMERRLKEQLARVEHALSKFEKGTYGRCDNCGQPIDPARLQALPEANLCMKCAQQAMYAKHKSQPAA
ncbi:MAG: TraR/DksA C4-type zinc finger protein [Dehalococcoidales bacterium]|nr:TraR/DksA C4-type zinc finger protein [Dehalococcoidales bacterium]